METQEEKSTSIAKILGIGCLTLFMILGLGTCYVMKNIKNIGAEFGQKIAEGLLDETLLPEEDKSQLKEVLNEVVDEFKQGKINEEQFTAMMESFAEGGIIPAMGLRFFEVTYLETADLPKEEIQKYAQVLSRYRWGIIRDEITSAKGRYKEIMDIIMIKKEDKDEFKKSLTLNELKSCIEIMAEVAGENKIPDEYYKINLADEIRDVLNRAKEKVKNKQPESNQESQ